MDRFFVAKRKVLSFGASEGGKGGKLLGRHAGDKKSGTLFFAKRNLGGNFLNCYHPVKAPPRDKQIL
jgi:hypothetical protein